MTAANSINVAGEIDVEGNTGSTGAGGNISFNSGTQTFNLASLLAFSASAAPGTLTFYGSGSASSLGTPISTPTVTFASGSSIDVSGVSASATPSLSFNLAGSSTSLGYISTSNTGTGAAGSVNLTSSGSFTTGSIITTSASSTSGYVTLTGTSVGFSSINAGNATVTLQPNQSEAVAVGGTSSSAPFFVSNTMLTNVTAGTLVVGTTGQAGGLTVAASITVPSSGAGSYNLDFENGGNYTANGQTITLGAKSLTVNALGTADTGAVTATTGNINVNAAGTLTASNNVTTTSGTVTFESPTVVVNSSKSVSAGGVVTIEGYNGAGALTLTDNGAITGGGNVDIWAPGSALVMNGSPTAAITSTSGSINIGLGGSSLPSTTTLNTAYSFAATTSGQSVNIESAGALNVNGALTENTPTANIISTGGAITFGTGATSTFNGGSGATANFSGYGVTLKGVLAFGESLNITSVGSISTAALNTHTTDSTPGGNVTLTATTSITVSAGGIFAVSQNSTGGNIILNSGTQTFNLGSLYTYSNAAAPGTITFYGSGSASSPGTPIATPTVTFTSNANIQVSGTSSSATPSLSFNLAGSNSLDLISTLNLGSGGSGSVTLTSSNPITATYIQTLNDGGGTGGNVTVTSTGGGVTISEIDTASQGTGSGNSGNIIVTAAGGVNLGYIATSSSGTGTGNAGNVTVTATGNIVMGEMDVEADIGSIGTGGNISLNSGTQTFSLATIYAYSATAAPGTLTFYGSGSASSPGTPIATPTVTFASASDIDVSGVSASATPSLSFNLAGSSTSLGYISTSNTGTGAAGSVNLTSSGSFTTGSITTTSASSTNGYVTLTGTSVGFSSINAGNAIVTLQPNQSEAVAVGGTSSSAPFFVSNTMLSNVTAGTLVVGTTGQAGGLTVASNITVPSSGAGSYNLDFENGGNYTANGQTITLGAKSLTVNALGTADTGSVTATTGNINVNAAGTLTASNNVTTTSGTITFESPTVVVNSSKSVSAGGVVTIEGYNATGALTLTDNGAITGGGNVDIWAPGGALVMNGSPTSAITSTGGAINIGLGGSSLPTTLNINSAYGLTASTSGQSINIESSSDMTLSGALTFTTGTNSNVLIESTTGTVNVNATNTYAIAGSTVTFQGGTAVVFGSGAVQNVGNNSEVQLVVQSPQVTLTDSGTELIAGGSDSTILIHSVGGGSLTLTDNGTITAGNTVDILAPNNSITLNGTSTATITASDLVQIGTAATTTVSINNSYNISPGQLLEIRAGTAVTFGAGTTTQVSSSISGMEVIAPQVTLATGTGGGAVINVSGNSGRDIDLGSAGSSAFTLTDNGTITAAGVFISTNSNSITLNGTPAAAITATKSDGISISAGGSGAINISTPYSFVATGAGNSVSIQSGGALNVNGVLTVNSPTTTISSSSGAVTFTASGTFNGGSGSTVNISGNGVTLTSLTASKAALNVTSVGSIAASGTIDTSSASAAGGNIVFDSSTGTFSLASLNTYSGASTAGTLTFNESGTNLPQPTVTFASGSNIDVHGTSSSATPSLSFNLPTGTSLGTISTVNSGSGSAGSVTLAATGAGALTVNNISTTANGGTGGAISLTATTLTVGGTINGGGSLTVQPLSSGALTLTDNGTITAVGNVNVWAPGNTITMNGTPAGAIISTTGSINIGLGGSSLPTNININSASSFTTQTDGQGINIESSGDMTLGGNLTFSLYTASSGNVGPGGCCLFIESTTGTVNVNGSNTYIQTGPGSSMAANILGGTAVIFGAGTTQNIGVSGFNVESPQITLATGTGGGAVLNGNAGNTSMWLIPFTTGGAMTLTDNGTITTAGNTLILEGSPLILNGTPAAPVQSNGFVEIAASALTISSPYSFTGDEEIFQATGGDININSPVTFNSSGGLVQIITSTASGGNVNLNSAITFNTNNIFLSAGSSSGTLNVNATNIYNMDAGSTISFGGKTAVVFAAGTTQNFGSNAAVTISSPQVTLSTGTGGGAQLMTGGGQSITIQARVASGPVTLTNNGTITADGNLNIWAPGGAVTLNGTPAAAVTSSSGSIDIGLGGSSLPSTVTISTPYNLVATTSGQSVNVESSGALGVNGALTVNSPSTTISSTGGTVSLTAGSTFSGGSGSTAAISGTSVSISGGSGVTYSGTHTAVTLTTPSLTVASSTTYSANSINYRTCKWSVGSSK